MKSSKVCVLALSFCVLSMFNGCKVLSLASEVLKHTSISPSEPSSKENNKVVNSTEIQEQEEVKDENVKKEEKTKQKKEVKENTNKVVKK